jgi:serine/threonine protein phosphatase 1
MSITWAMPTKLWSGTPAPRPIRLSPDSTEGRLIYAVGDIHGRRDLLQILVRKIAVDAIASGAGSQPVLIFLGDYVDRGPESAGVASYIMALAALEGFDVRCLKGNHEQTLLRFLEDAAIGPTWADHGGGATLASYGVTIPTKRGDKPGWEATRLAFNRALPDDHRRFYNGLDLSVVFGDYFFVHAGVRPGLALAEQTEQDLLWSRSEFLAEKRPFEKIIVHGHTPVEEAYLGPTRIAVDTGAYATGALSAVRLDGIHRSVISTAD